MLRLGVWLLRRLIYPRFSIQLPSCCCTWLQEKACWTAGCVDIISSLKIVTACCFLLRTCKSLINMKGAVIVMPSQKEASGFCPKFFFVLWIYIQNRTLGSEFRRCVWGWTLSKKVVSSDCSNTYRKDFIISTIVLSLPPWLSTAVPLWDKEIVYKIPVFFPRVVQGVGAKKWNITFLRLESIQ